MQSNDTFHHIRKNLHKDAETRLPVEQPTIMQILAGTNLLHRQTRTLLRESYQSTVRSDNSVRSLLNAHNGLTKLFESTRGRVAAAAAPQGTAFRPMKRMGF